MDADSRIGLKITFRLELHRNGAMYDTAWEIAKTFIPSKPATVSVIVSDVGIVVDSWAAGSRVIVDLRKGYLVAIDTKQRCYTKVPIQAVEKNSRDNPARPDGWTIQKSESGGSETLGGKTFYVRRYRLPVTPLGHFADAVVTRDLGLNPRINRIIHWLLGVPDLPDSATLVNLQFGEAHDGSSLARLQLAGTEEIEWNDKWLRVPPTFRQGDCLQELIGDLSRFGRDTVPTREVRNSDHLSSLSESRRIGASHRLRSGVQNCARVVGQEYLDQIREFVNRCSSGIRSFCGDGDGGREPAHLVIDWFQQMEEGGHLDRDMTRERLALLALLLKVAAGKPLVLSDAHPDGLDAEERIRWDLIRSRAEPRRRTVGPFPDSVPITGQIDRILDFRSVFGVPGNRDGTDAMVDARVLQLALAEFEPIVAPKRVEIPFDGGPLYRSYDEILWGMFFYRLENFGLSLEIDHQEIVKRLEFQDGEILAELNVPSLQVNCNFQLGPTNHVVNALLTIFTAGVYAVATVLTGDLSAELRDAQLTVSLAPERQPDRTISLHATIDWARSELPLTVHPGPLTPKASLTLLWDLNSRFIVKPIMAEALQAVLEASLGEGINLPLLEWPTTWHGEGARAAMSTALLFQPTDNTTGKPGAGIWVGDEPSSRGLTGLSIDPSYALTEAYAFAPGHLTDWLRSRLGTVGQEQLFPADPLLDGLEPTLPDPSSLPLPETDDASEVSSGDWRAVNCLQPPPPAIDVGSENVLLVRRANPIVRLPEDPRAESEAAGPFESQVVGTFEVAYEFRIMAMRQRETPRPVVLREGTGMDDPRFANVDRMERPGMGSAGNIPGPFPPAPGGHSPSGYTGGPQSPSGGLGRPGSGGACAYTCSWEYRHERVVLADYLQAFATVRGELLIDFQTSDLGWIPALRLSVLGDARSGGIAPSLETNVSVGQREEPFGAADLAEIERVLSGIAVKDMTALLARDGEIVRARGGLPPFPATEKHVLPSALGLASKHVHSALAPMFIGPGAIVNLISWQGANYIVADGMVYWPIRVGVNSSLLFRD